ncbi:MAG: YfhO family protein [Bacteroidales bacterium]|nr:YfhO family protein [Bacteroidales bacterium]
MEKYFKKLLPWLISISAIVIISVFYFSPDIFEGKMLFQGDTQQGIAIGQEAKAFNEQTGETTRWTNSLFGGMPNFQISPSYENNKVIRAIEKIYSLGLPIPVSYIYIMAIGFFILLMTLNVKWYFSLLGSLAYAFSSYFFIIIAAGHIWKFITLAYIPPTIAGIILAYQGKYIKGALLAAFFGMLQIHANHIQMSYYSFLFIIPLVIGYAVNSVAKKELKVFGKATLSLMAAAILAVAANLPSIYNTYEYSKETMRGKSELASESKGQEGSGGLSIDYITQWSYGIGESWTLLVPDTKGGASGYISQDKEAMKEADPQMRQFVGQMNRYWGDQPFTAGPVYVGAIVMFLFLLGCIIVKGPIKWVCIVATIASLLLSWGHNFMPLTEWFVNNMPMYDKFRTVSSILVVAEFAIPLLAILALKELLEKGKDIKNFSVKFFVPLGIIMVILLAFMIMPSVFFNFLSKAEVQEFSKYPEYKIYIDELIDVRKSIFVSDVWRSFLFIALSVPVLLLMIKNNNKRVVLGISVAILSMLVIFDMYPVNKRYLSSKNFVSERRVKNPFPKTEADMAILQDDDPNFRVLNLTVDTYNDPTTSYYHKSVGGYSAAKLRRYDDLIKYQLSQGNMSVINMLNTKYFITQGEDGVPVAMYNPEASGNAWFVSEVKWVDGAKAEMEALNDFNEKETAVVDKHFADIVSDQIYEVSEEDVIYLTSYQPNKLNYKSVSKNGGLAVFSEIYFPWGWQITIDGEPAEMARVNYVLRGVNIPAGEHEIEFRFEPTSLKVNTIIAFISIAIILFAGAVIVVNAIKNKKKGC